MQFTNGIIVTMLTITQNAVIVIIVSMVTIKEKDIFMEYSKALRELYIMQQTYATFFPLLISCKYKATTILRN